MILVIGSTGQVGKEVVKNLSRANLPFLAAVRNLEKAQHQLGSEVPLVHFDYNLPDGFSKALEKADKLFFIAPPNSKDPKPVIELLEAAKSSGIQQIIFHSGRTTGDIEGSPLNTIEKLTAQSGIPYTILRPGWFMQNFFSWAGTAIKTEHQIVLPAGNAAFAFVDVRDLGAAVAEIFNSNGHDGKIYELTTSKAINHFQVAEMISNASSLPVTYSPTDEDGFIEWALKRGWKPEAAAFTAHLYSLTVYGKEAEVSPDLEHILSRPPITFEQFALDFKRKWIDS